METIAIKDNKYFSFQQFPTFEKALEAGKEHNFNGYTFYILPNCDSNDYDKMIEIHKKEMQAAGLTFDPSGAFIG